jgi:hypothetical protein
MAGNDDSAANDDNAARALILELFDPLSATVATADDTPRRNIPHLMSKLAGHRAEFFVLIEMLETTLGRGIDVLELERCIDSEYDGRAKLSEREALTVLRTASGFRVIGRCKRVN